MAIDVKRIRLLIRRNRADILGVDTYFRAKIAALVRWAYFWLEREGRARRAAILRDWPTEQATAWLRKNVERLPPRSRFYAGAILFETDLRAELDRLEIVLPRIKEDLELLRIAISLKERERDFLADLVVSLRDVIPERPEWREVVERVLKLVERRLEELRSMVPPPPPPVQRVAVSLYIIVESGEKSYTYPPPTGRRYRRYPSGKFQSTWEADGEVDPTGKIKVAEDDMNLMKRDFCYELEQEFECYYDVGDVTEGVASVIPNQTEVGKPPKKLTLERVVDKPVPENYYPKDSWQKTIGEFLRR